MIFRSLTLACAFCAVFSSQLTAQDLPLGPKSDFGKTVLSTLQSAKDTLVLEQMIGDTFDAEPVHLYPEFSVFRKLGRAVGRLDLMFENGTGSCTAFVISARYLLTNRHCFHNKGQTPQAARFTAGYIETGVSDGTAGFLVMPLPVEENKDLDFAIAEVFGDPSEDWGRLQLDPMVFDNDLHQGLPLFVIGHPAKQAQHVIRKDCRAARQAPLTNNRLRHTCDTLVGNSGSPVISLSGKMVIALHHAGDKAQGINYAIPISEIAKASPIIAGLIADEQAPKEAPKMSQQSMSPCDKSLDRLRVSGQCGDMDRFLKQCATHNMARFVAATVELKCQARPEPPLNTLADMAQDRSVQKCDDLAGSPWHPDTRTATRDTGRALDQITSQPALAACTDALAAFPDEPRLLTNLGRALTSSGDMQNAFKALHQAARLGDVVAMNNLASLYHSGSGVDQDFGLAQTWYRKGAEAGFAPAQYNLGAMLGAGDGMAISDEAATKWYRTAADGGFDLAQLRLAIALQQGRGVPKSEALAVIWLDKAAAQGNADAQTLLGVAMRDGKGIAKSPQDALQWFRTAAEQGHADALTYLGHMHETGQGIPADSTKARDWYKQAALQGSAYAAERLLALK